MTCCLGTCRRSRPGNLPYAPGGGRPLSRLGGRVASPGIGPVRNLSICRRTSPPGGRGSHRQPNLVSCRQTSTSPARTKSLSSFLFLFLFLPSRPVHGNPLSCWCCPLVGRRSSRRIGPAGGPAPRPPDSPGAPRPPGSPPPSLPGSRCGNLPRNHAGYAAHAFRVPCLASIHTYIYVCMHAESEQSALQQAYAWTCPRPIEAAFYPAKCNEALYAAQLPAVLHTFPPAPASSRRSQDTNECLFACMERMYVPTYVLSCCRSKRECAPIV